MDESARVFEHPRTHWQGEGLTPPRGMSRKERERFDKLFDEVFSQLPATVHAMLEEAPIILEDHPSEELAAELGIDLDDPEDILCGLHSGVPLTERSVSDAEGLETIHLFRMGILDLAGGWEAWEDDEGQEWGGSDRIRAEIRITILHEVGHHFGLDETDLDRLGYA